jgi:hypothetical protein
VPFKVWALIAGSEGRSPGEAIPLFIVARGTRMAIVATLACILGQRFTSMIRNYCIFLAMAYLALFLYVWWHLIS